MLLAGFQILTVGALLVSKYMLAAWFSFVAPEIEFFCKNCPILEAALHSAVKSKIQIILNLNR